MKEIYTSTAIKILIVGGVLNIGFGFVAGHILGVIRIKNPAATEKYLLTAHKNIPQLASEKVQIK